MSPTKPSSRRRAAGEIRADKAKTAKPRAARTAKAAAEKTVRSRAAKPRPPEAAEQQLDLIAPVAQEAHGRPAPAHAQSPGKPRAIATAPAQEKQRPSLLLIALVLLLMLGSFWIGRISSRPATQEAASVSAASASTPAAATVPSSAAQTVAGAPQASAGARPATTTSPANVSRHAGVETSLVEVSVGTTSRGGLTLRFDHPVTWQLDGAQGGGQAEVEVHGVRALGTFPRNLPLPPGVSTLRAGITAPDTLNLKFGLQPGIRAFTVPGTGPAASLNIYFRTPAEEAEAASEPATGACGSSASPQAAKAVGLLQHSLDKNPEYEAVRQALALLETCAGDGAKAEQLLAEGTKSDGGVKLAVTDVALRYARGDVDGALKELRTGMPAGNSDAGYQELLADLEAAKQP